MGHSPQYGIHRHCWRCGGAFFVENGEERATPIWVPVGRVICDECTGEVSRTPDAKTRKVVAWAVIIGLVIVSVEIVAICISQLTNWSK